MELSNHHRETLLDALATAQSDKARANNLISSESAKKDLSFAESCEVSEWLAALRIEAIRRALITNNLENY